jgi:hypothetical protein
MAIDKEGRRRFAVDGGGAGLVGGGVMADVAISQSLAAKMNGFGAQMGLSFLFLDECQSDALDATDTRISSLTGLLVPAENYKALRERFYSLNMWAIRTGHNEFNLNPPELHGSDFLRSEDDSRKLKTFTELVDLVVNGGVDVYRIGYYVTGRLRSAFASDPKLIGLCWFSMVNKLQAVLEERAVVPVMDMGDDYLVRCLSGQVRSMDILRAVDCKNMSVNWTENLFGEVFYADSRFSALIQVADIVSYLRHTADMHREGRLLTTFRQKLLQIAEAIEPAIAFEEIIAFNYEGEDQRPTAPRKSS